MCFPFSRTNSIREDGKIYAAMLPDLGLTVSDLLKTKSDELFKKRISKNFQSIYTWLNHGHPLGEIYDERFVKDTRTQIINGKPQKQYCYRVKKFAYSTILPRHAVQGRKWERRERYLGMNILNLFFSNSRTIEFRIHEASTNFEKILYYLCLNVAILKYAEKFEKVFSKEAITLTDIIKDHFPEKIANTISGYLAMRQNTFCTGGKFNTDWKNIEASWYDKDKLFKYEINPIYKL
jgi:hypothetical protein